MRARWTITKRRCCPMIGIGMAGLLMEEYFGAGSFVNGSVALDDPGVYQGVAQVETAQPDYLMWESWRALPTTLSSVKARKVTPTVDQLRRGLEQVPSLVFGAGARPVATLVVATCMEENGTTVFVLDPPPGARRSFKAGGYGEGIGTN